MISTTAATRHCGSHPIPVKPASEIGVSITRSAPNSSTRPDSTLNGVPASATSSPKNAHARIAAHLFRERFADRLCNMSALSSPLQA